MKPQQFDILGAIAFLYIVGFAFYAILHDGHAPLWSIDLLAFIGLMGLLVDTSIVYTYFLKKKK